MLRSTNQLAGYAIEARDGRIGKVVDFYFDDFVWRVRYLVAATGGWLSRKEVLISPAALDTPRPEEKMFPVKLTQDQVRNSPEVETDKPVSRQMEESMSTHYGWPLYWSMEPFPLAATPGIPAVEVDSAIEPPSGDPHLRSIQEVIGYEVRASDQETEAGKVTDFIVDDEDWTVRYVVVRATTAEGERECVLNPWWTREIDWSLRTMHFDLPVERILASPSFDSALSIDRDYELRLHDYYRRPPYWQGERRL